LGRVLIPITKRPNLSVELWDRAQSNFDALIQRMFIGNWAVNYPLITQEYPKWYPQENFYARLARMRNEVMDSYLTADIDWVLWIDVDISFESSLFFDLMATGPLHAIKSPVVLIEGTEHNYDTAGFREHFERRSRKEPPWFDQEGPLVQLKSIGGVALVPAHVHRQCRFSALPDEDTTMNTEWWGLCECARLNGVQVLVDTRIRTYHADLPKYGEVWHGE